VEEITTGIVTRSPVCSALATATAKALPSRLPKTRLGAAMVSRLKVYRGAEHPHAAQQPKKLDIPR
jgi:ribosomal protein L13